MNPTLILEFYVREDDKYGWRLKADNNEIIANDAGQGFENKQDCIDSASLATGYPTRGNAHFEVKRLGAF